MRRDAGMGNQTDWERLMNDNPPIGYEPAGFGRRFGAWWLDWLAFSLLAIPVMFALTILNGFYLPPAFLTMAMVGIIYFIGYESSAKQKTLGKKRTGIKIVDNNGNRPSLGSVIIRKWPVIIIIIGIHWIFIVPGIRLVIPLVVISPFTIFNPNFFQSLSDMYARMGWVSFISIGLDFIFLSALLSCISVLFDKNKRAWHDKLANCWVVKDAKPIL